MANARVRSLEPFLRALLGTITIVVLQGVGPARNHAARFLSTAPFHLEDTEYAHRILRALGQGNEAMESRRGSKDNASRRGGL